MDFTQKLMPQPIALPPMKALVVADKNDMETLDDFKSQKQKRVFLHPEECQDYVYDRTNNCNIARVKTITINGTQFHLVPGWNKVPVSVYVFMQEARGAQEKAHQAIPSYNLSAHLPGGFLF